MCGIAGIVARYERREIGAALESMTCALARRGPDGRGTVVRSTDGWNVGLGHTRLAILDLSDRGAQPMAGTDRQQWLTYNGEVYNFLDLRHELESAGFEFTSRTDTEAILHAYRCWGVQCLLKLRGMFGFGIWDGTAGSLLVARDSFGIKPLYYYHSEDLFLFASEVRAILASGLVPRKLCPRGVASYLQFGSVSAPWTLIKGIRCLEPGHGLTIRAGPRLQLTKVAFETPADPAAPLPETRHEAAARLKTTLLESVSRHLISDVPVGLFLSGGIDSSVLLALMAELRQEKTWTFNVTFAEKQYAEHEHADRIARAFGARHETITLTETGLLKLLPEAIRSLDQPTMDGMNTYVVSRMVRERGLKVALSGLGGDELFGGYASFRRARALLRLRPVPHAVRHLVARAGRAIWNGAVSYDKFWDLLDSDTGPAAAYAISRRVFSPKEIRQLAGSAAPAPVLPDTGPDLINAVSKLELRGYMANTLLRDTDVMSMAHALEVRVPFIDARVVRFVEQIPGKWKHDGRRPKPLLLDAMGDAIPPEVWQRPKMGFGFPFRRWLLSELGPEVDSVLSRPGVLAPAGIDAAEARAVWARFRTNPACERWSRPWSLYILQKWCEAIRATS